MTERNDDNILEQMEHLEEMDSRALGLIPTMMGIIMMKMGLTTFTFTKQEYENYFKSGNQVIFKINPEDTTLELVPREILDAMIESVNSGLEH